MDSWKSYFTFPVFYTAVLKDNTHLNQYDAVNVLLVGEKLTGSDETLPHITPNMTSHYARGGKPISKEIVGNFLDLSPDERALRIARARIISEKEGATCLYRLLSSEHILMDEERRQHLLQLYPDDISVFLDESLHQSISCPRNHLSKLDESMIADILSYRSEDYSSAINAGNTIKETTDKQFSAKANEASADDITTTTPNTTIDATGEWNNAEERDIVAQTFLTEENLEQNPLIRKSAIARIFGTNDALCFAQKRLQPSSDLKAIEKYLTSISEFPSLLSLSFKDIPEIIQRFSNCKYIIITEIRASINDLEKYIQLLVPSNTSYIFVFAEGNIEFLELNNIATVLHNVCDKDIPIEFYLYDGEIYPDSTVTLHLLSGHPKKQTQPAQKDKAFTKRTEKHDYASHHKTDISEEAITKINIPDFLRSRLKDN